MYDPITELSFNEITEAVVAALAERYGKSATDALQGIDAERDGVTMALWNQAAIALESWAPPVYTRPVTQLIANRVAEAIAIINFGTAEEQEQE